MSCVCGEINTRHCPVHGQGDRPRWPYIAAPSVGTVWKWRLTAWRIELGRWLRGE